MFKQGKGAVVAPKAKGIEKTIKEVHDKKADLAMQPLYAVRYFARSLDLEEILLMQTHGGIDCSPFIAEVTSNSPLLRMGLDEGLITKSNATSDIKYKIRNKDGDPIGESKSRIDGLSNMLLNNLITVQVPKTGLGKIQLDGIIESGFVIEGIEYHVLTWTPGSSRRGSLIFAAMQEKEIQYLQNKIGGGVLLEEVKRKIGTKDAHKLLTKLGSRVGQFSSPGLFAGQIGWNQGTGFIVIDGKLQGPSDFNAGLKGLENDRELYDGQAMFLDELMQSVLNTAANEKLFSLGEARRCAVQIRTDKIYSKICADAYTRASFDALIAHVKSRYKGYKVFGNSDNIVAIFDKNAAKIINMEFLEKDINVNKNSMKLYLLAVAKEHNCKTSSQLLNKLGAFDKDATLAWVEKTKEKEVEEIINTNAEGNGSMYDDPEKLYAPNAIWNIATRAYEGNKDLYFNIAKCEPILNSLVGQTVKKINSDIANFRVKLEKASSLTVLFDPSYLLSDRKIDGILGITKKGQIEVFCADRRGDAEASAMIGIKYPAPGLFDIERFQRISLEQIESRLKNLLGNKITQEEYVAILEKFKYAAYGVVYMGPINFIKRKLAGMDTDFDAVSLIWEPALVNIVEKGFEEEAKTRGVKGPWSGPIPYIEYGTL